MQVFDHLNEEHLYDDVHNNFVESDNRYLSELSVNVKVVSEEEWMAINQGRSQSQANNNEQILFWLFATSFALILACSVYLCLSALLN